jgi:hypothetical protein
MSLLWLNHHRTAVRTIWLDPRRRRVYGWVSTHETVVGGLNTRGITVDHFNYAQWSYSWSSRGDMIGRGLLSILRREDVKLLTVVILKQNRRRQDDPTARRSYGWVRRLLHRPKSGWPNSKGEHAYAYLTIVTQLGQSCNSNAQSTFGKPFPSM